MLHNQILSNKKTKKKLPLILISFGLFALFCIVSVFGYYEYIFSDFKIDASPDHFGQFGDFIGGTLNPILAFLSFMALLYTIKIQTDELKLSREELEATREELKGSRIAQQEQSESLKLQNEATNLQMFENTFFQLLDKHNELLNIILGRKNEFLVNFSRITMENTWEGTSEYEFFSIDEVFSNFREKNKEENKIKKYFMILYQLLRFIDDQSIKNKINGKQYTNILRALIDVHLLEVLAINCISHNFIEYKNYIEKYALFEHLIINKRTEHTEVLLQILSYFNDGAFGNNEMLLELVRS